MVVRKYADHVPCTIYPYCLFYFIHNCLYVLTYEETEIQRAKRALSEVTQELGNKRWSWDQSLGWIPRPIFFVMSCIAFLSGF